MVSARVPTGTSDRPGPSSASTAARSPAPVRRLRNPQVDAAQRAVHPQHVLGPRDVHEQHVAQTGSGQPIGGLERAEDRKAPRHALDHHVQRVPRGDARPGRGRRRHHDAAPHGQEPRHVDARGPPGDVRPEGSLGEGVDAENPQGLSGQPRGGREALDHGCGGAQAEVRADPCEEALVDRTGGARDLVRRPARHGLGRDAEGGPRALDREVDREDDRHAERHPQDRQNELHPMMDEVAEARPRQERHGRPSRSRP